MLLRAVGLALLPALLAACATMPGDDRAPAPLTLAGDVNRPATLSPAQLQALPAITQQVSYAGSGGRQTRTYTGASLWPLLDQAGITTNPAVHNDLLSKYVVATGAGNYRAVFSLGELSPGFGNRAGLVAYAETIDGSSRPLATNGPLRLTAPGDVRGGRYVSGLTRLEVRSAVSSATGTGGGPSQQLHVGGMVSRPTTHDLASLQALPAMTRTVGSHTYTGVNLWALLNAAGIARPPAGHGILDMYVVATGSDGYRVVIALAEISPDFGNQPDLVAYALDGAPLTASGFARLVVPNDNRAGRHVSSVVALEVVAAPEAP
ncbi:hypothetical protein GCM10027081_36570 [Cupriavidus yeoncheonensis]